MKINQKYLGLIDQDKMWTIRLYLNYKNKLGGHYINSTIVNDGFITSDTIKNILMFFNNSFEKRKIISFSLYKNDTRYPCISQFNFI